MQLADGTDALAISPNGKTLVATARTGKVSKVQLIDPAKMELRGTFSVNAVSYDVAVANNDIAYISGGSGDWTDISVVDLTKEHRVIHYGSIWTRSFVALALDQKRLYHSSQGVTPGTVAALVLPKKAGSGEDARSHVASARVGNRWAAQFQLTADGRFLLCHSGTVLRLSNTDEDDLKFHTAVEPFVAAAVDPEGGLAFFVTRDGTLEQYSYPAFELKKSYRLDIVPYQLAVDGKQGKLYLAGFDPRRVADHPRARGFGDLFVFDLKQLTVKKK